MPSTRRRFIRGAAAALLAGVAGCNGDAYGSATASGGSSRPDAGPVPDHYTLRNPANEAPVWFHHPDATETERRTVSDRLRETHGFVASEEKAERLRFADVDGAAEARRFVDGTDFDGETIYVETESVSACRTLSLCGVSWTNSSIHTDYGSTYRDADVACEADDRDGVSTLIRIPEALDPNAINRYGSGWSSSGCHLRRRDGERTTEPPNFGPKSATNGSATETPTTRTTEADR